MNSSNNLVLKQLIPVVLLVGLLYLSYQVLNEFLLSLVWAFILAFVSWPLYKWLDKRLNNNKLASASIMSLFVSTIIFLLIYWLAVLLQDELKSAYYSFIPALSRGEYRLPKEVLNIPGIGHSLQEWLDRFQMDKSGLALQTIGWLKQWLGNFASFLGNLGHYALKLGVVLVTLFFCYRDGEEAIVQLHRGILQFLGKHQDIYLQAAGHTTRAVVYGLVLAALAQGLLAGIGYYVAGVQAPVLFGAITALLAMVPMGATLVWVPIGLALIVSGQVWAGVGLLVWGVTGVSTVDNVIKPLVISGASKVPFLIVMFGVLGGLSAFGAIGIFLGPVILAVMLAVWQAWLEQQEA